MKSKFEEFNDGIMNLYSENENGKLVRKFEDNLRFGEENVSIQRHYAAQAADQQVDKVIHVPLLEIFEAHDVAVCFFIFFFRQVITKPVVSPFRMFSPLYSVKCSVRFKPAVVFRCVFFFV